MKKLLGSTLALAMVLPAGANAELLKNLKVGGSLDVDAVTANNVTDLNTASYDKLNTVQTRLILKSDWDLLDDVHAHVALRKNDRTWGTGSQAIGGGTGSGVLANTFVDESNVKIDKVFGAVDTTVGRQFYGEPGDLVIYYGPKANLYGLPVTALDGARLDWNGEKVGVTALGAKITGKAIQGNTPSNNGDVNLWGLTAHAKVGDNVSGSAYIYDRRTVNSGNGTGGVVADDILYLAGLRGKVTMGGAWLSGEFDKDFGQNRTMGTNNTYATTGNYTGWAGKVNAGVKADLNNLGAITGWGEAGIGSGGQTTNRNFTSIAGDYRPGGIWGRFASTSGGTDFLGSAASANAIGDGASLSNLFVTGVGAKVTPAALSKLTAGLTWWNYRAQNATALENQVGPSKSARGNKAIGSEYDLDLTWAHSENVAISAGAGTFQQGRVLRALGSGTNNPITLCYTDLSVKF